LGYVSLQLTQAALVHVASWLIVPSTFSDEPIDLTAFFDRNRRKFMSVVLILAIVNEATNLTLPGFGSLLIGLMIMAWIVLLTVGMIWKSQRVQLTVAAACLSARRVQEDLLPPLFPRFTVHFRARPHA
jgi:hypothetical protein